MTGIICVSLSDKQESERRLKRLKDESSMPEQKRNQEE